MLCQEHSVFLFLCQKKKKEKEKETHPNDSTTCPAKGPAVLFMKLQGAQSQLSGPQPRPGCCVGGKRDKAATKTCSENSAGFPRAFLPEQRSGCDFSKQLKADGTGRGTHPATDQPIHKR